MPVKGFSAILRIAATSGNANSCYQVKYMKLKTQQIIETKVTQNKVLDYI